MKILLSAWSIAVALTAGNLVQAPDRLKKSEPATNTPSPMMSRKTLLPSANMADKGQQ
jgi:hypothetical protein